MKTLHKALTLVMVTVIALGWTTGAYARSASISTHGTIVILPRQEEPALAGAGLAELPELPEKPAVEMATRTDTLKTPQGEKMVYTIVGAL
jgi:hypothetical protein